MSLPTLIVFLGAHSESQAEELLAASLRAAGLDLIHEALATGAFEKAIVATDDSSIQPDLPAGAEIDLDQEPFHFGRRLSALVRERGIERPFYAGAGAVPLMRGSDIAAIACHLVERDSVVISNNYFSADLIAWSPGNAIDRIDPVESDNFLPRLLHDQAGLESSPLPRSAATQFNIDSPADLTILKVAGGGGPRLSAMIDGMEAQVEPYAGLMRLIVDPNAELLLAGRVGSQVWPYLEKETACRLRVFSEERGMQAAGRHTSGAARTLLGFHLLAVGCRRFFDDLAEMSDAACIDTRPLLAHLGIEASRGDRFWSDLGCAQEITEPFLREFTSAAADAPIPVILGGHSLIAGGLMLLSEAAWRAEDRRTSGESV